MAHTAATVPDRTAGLIKCPRVIGRPGHRDRTTNEHELYNPWRTVEHAMQRTAHVRVRALGWVRRIRHARRARGHPCVCVWAEHSAARMLH